jgi:predicted transcriptional regulator of viral defense system
MSKLSKNASSRAKAIIRDCGEVIRTVDALKRGIHPRTLYQLRDSGQLVELSHGVYRLEGCAPLSNPDLVIVASRVPKAIVCLISALAFHEITTQIPHHVSIALPKGATTPQIEFPPIVSHRFSGASLTEGIEEQHVDGVLVKIYCPEKTIADCFKFRNKIGIDVAIEALKLYKARKNFDLKMLLKYAKICRVKNVMLPYLEASL